MAINTIKSGKLEYLTAENIAATHCFTTRRGGVSSGIFDSLNIALHGGDSEENVGKNLEILSKAMGFELDKLVLTRQIHSDIVRVVTDADHIGLDHHAYPNCDALVTNTPEGRIFAMMYGVFSSLALPLETIMLSLITTDLFGNKSFDKMLGIVSALNVAGYAVGAPLMNWSYDLFGTYVPFIWVCAGIMVVVTVMYQFVISAAQKERKAILAAEAVAE